MLPFPHRPITIAHRAANDLDHLAEAQSRAVDVIEGDVWLHRNSLEVRHHKTAGPVPVLWDRWTVQKGWVPRLTLRDLFHAADESTFLMLDLKGWNLALPDRVLDVIRSDESPRKLAVCAQTWSFVDRFKDCPNVTRVYSIGSHRMLRRFAASPVSDDAPVISINARLIDSAVARLLKIPNRTLIAWNVPTLDRAQELLALGVDGIISENSLILSQLERRPYGEPASSDRNLSE